MIKFCCRLTIHTLICALLNKRILARTSGIFGDLMSAESKTNKNTNTADNISDEQPGDCAKHKTEALKTDSECAATNPSEAESANNENASKKAEAKNANSECAAAQVAVAEPINDTRHDTDTSINLKYDGMRQVAKGGALGAFIGLAVIVPGGERFCSRHYTWPVRKAFVCHRAYIQRLQAVHTISSPHCGRSGGRAYCGLFWR